MCILEMKQALVMKNTYQKRVVDDGKESGDVGGVDEVVGVDDLVVASHRDEGGRR